MIGLYEFFQMRVLAEFERSSQSLWWKISGEAIQCIDKDIVLELDVGFENQAGDVVFLQLLIEFSCICGLRYKQSSTNAWHTNLADIGFGLLGWKSSDKEVVRGLEVERSQTLDQSVTMIVKLLKVPVDVLGLKSNGVFILVGKVLGVQCWKVLANSLDKSHLASELI